MNLSQALKQKNRLAGELVRQQQILQRENSHRIGSVSTVDCELVYGKILDLSTQLGELKGKITVANIGVYPMLERMAELKARITYIKSLPKRVGEETIYTGPNTPADKYTWVSFIDQAGCDTMVELLQKQVNEYQDKIDRFNAVTEIE